MSRLRNQETPVRGAIIAVIAFVVIGSLPCWGAAGLDDLAGPLRTIALRAERGQPLPQMGPAGVGADGSVLAVVQFRDQFAANTGQLEALGARVRFHSGNRIEALIPADRLLDVAELPEVAQVRPPVFAQPLQGFGATLSEGVQLVGAVPFHVAGARGQDVTVAIIDTGFAGYDSAEIPVEATYSFRADGTMGSDSHGTAVAEIVADMAPGADIVLIAVDTAMSTETAVNFVANRGFDVANMSIGLVGGPYNGTHPLSEAVTRARDLGTLMVVAAGNEAGRHYQGEWRDSDRDNFHEFAAGDESCNVMLPAGTYVAYLSWFETAGETTSRDYDLVLYDQADNEVARSGFGQNGDDPPADVLAATITTAGQYSLRIEYVSGPADHPDRFQLFSPDIDIEATHRVPASSLTIPAEAEGAYTVGAVRGTSVDDPNFGLLPINTLEPFSSQGPVVGHPERIKPDLVAPDAVTTAVAGYAPFFGTSAAAPHVAGAAALLISEDQFRTADEVETVFRMQALQLGDPVPNNQFGFGRLRMRLGADSRPPTITIAYPQNGTTITTRTPTIIAFMSDGGSGVAPETITVQLDGVEIFNGADVADITEYFDARTGQFTLPVQTVLARSSHNVVLGVEDGAGNSAEPAIANFRIAAPTVPKGISMVSFPYRDLQETDPSVILGTPLSELALVRWWPLDESPNKYHFYPDARASLIPPDTQQTDLDERTVPYPPAGLGYFLSLPRQAVLDIQGQPLRDVPSSHIRLYRGEHAPRGWNLIGNPFDEDISWGTVQFVTRGVRQDLRDAIDDGVTEGVLFELVQGPAGQPGYYDFNPQPERAMLEAGKGYWIHVNEDTRVIIYSSNMGAASDATEIARPSNDDGWLLTLCARGGNSVDPANYIGVSSAATEGYDPGWDVPKPPPLTDGVRLSMQRSGWGEHAGAYAMDVRAAGQSNSWDIEVAAAPGTGEVEISWPGLNAEVPGDVRLLLEDLETGEGVYMRTGSAYRFRVGPDGGVRHLRISTIGGAGALALSNISTRQVAGGGTVLTYSLSQAADVTVEVMNIAGRLVKRFPARTVEGGSQETLVWNGISDSGSAVPSGRYIVRLTALAADGQTVQAIRPFSIVR